MNTDFQVNALINPSQIIELINSINIYDWEEALVNMELISDYNLYSPAKLEEKILSFLVKGYLEEKTFFDVISYYKNR